MPKIRKPREYKFVIDAFTPETIPMSRLAQYVSDLAVVLGNDANVHLVRIEGGSTVPVVLVDWETEPKVRERLRAVKHQEAPPAVQEAAKRLDQRLLEDNAKGAIVDPVSAKVLVFPGRERANRQEFGPMEQAGVFQGIPNCVGGKGDWVPVHLEDGNNTHIVLAKRPLAKEIANHLFTSVVRVEGTGRWIRHADGEWEMRSFRVHSWKPIADADIRTNIAELQQIPAEWKRLEDPIAELDKIRRGEKIQ